MIGKELLAQAKPSLRIVNVSRGGVIDEDGARRGHPRGPHRRRRHRRVRHASPPPARRSSSCRRWSSRPHLGASTAEAQDKAGDTIAEQVAPGAGRRVRALRRERERGRGVEHRAARSCRWPSASGSSTPALAAGVPDVLEIGYEGQLADSDTRILTLSVLKGVFGKVSEEPVSYVNAPRLAEERGIEVRESSSSTSRDYVNLVTIRGGDHAIGGTLVGLRGEPRIVMVDDHSVDVPAGRPHARRPQRRRARDDRRRHRRAGRGRHQHRRHAPRALRARAGRRSWSWPPTVPVPDEVQGAIRALPGVVSVAALVGASALGGPQAVGLRRGGVDVAAVRVRALVVRHPGQVEDLRRELRLHRVAGGADAAGRARPTARPAPPRAVGRRGSGTAARPAASSARLAGAAGVGGGASAGCRSSLVSAKAMPPRSPSTSPMRNNRRITARTLAALTRCGTAAGRWPDMTRTFASDLLLLM